jgi:hypothetical protein
VDPHHLDPNPDVEPVLTHHPYADPDLNFYVIRIQIFI